MTGRGVIFLSVAALISGAGARSEQSSAVLSGTVVTAGAAPQLVQRAIVRLTGGGIATNLSTVSDDDGRFSFSTLPAGHYRLVASKPAFLAVEYGARRPGGLGTPISLTAAERREGIRLTLVPGAVVSGVVRDASGQPAPNVPITVSPAGDALGTAGYRSASDGVLTDDRGAFRVFGLAPGSYLIAATPRVLGMQGEVHRPTSTDLDVALRSLRQRASGSMPGFGAPPAAATPNRFAVAPVYYPGTPAPHEAVPITLGAGEVREALDFVADVVPAFTIAGTIATNDGSPPPAVSLSLTPIGPSMPTFSSLMYGGAQSSPGQFSYAHVTPGRYLLTARESAGRGTVTGRGGTPTPRSRWAAAEVDITNVDVPGVTLLLRTPLTFSGRVVFDAPGVTPPSPAAVQVTLVQAARAPAALAPFEGLYIAPANAADDGQFTVSNVLPGVFSLVVTAPGRWSVASATHDGRDLLDTPLVLTASSGDLANVTVRLTDRLASLTGRLQTSAGQPATDYAVVLFSPDRAHWFSGSRRVRMARPATDGVYAFATLPAGTYHLAARTDVTADDLADPAFLESLLPASLKIVIADRADVRQDLRLR